MQEVEDPLQGFLDNTQPFDFIQCDAPLQRFFPGGVFRYISLYYLVFKRL